MSDKIPFLDLVTPHLELEDELVEVFRKAVRTGRFIGGDEVEGFEKEFAQFCDSRHSVGVSSGTDALRFALIAAGVKQGDIVVTVPNTFIATTEAISQAGALPDFVDINEDSYNMDSKKLREYMESRCNIDNKTGRAVNKESGRPVTAVVPVHLYGHIADMDSIMEIAEKYNLLVIEDACQAHGAEYYSQKDSRWKKAGSIGTAGAFSFYPGKNLGACGEGGAVTTDDEQIAKKIRMLRDHGQSKKYYHEIEGYNGRLDAIQAGILRVKLRRLTGWSEDRRKRAHFYTEQFGNMDGVVAHSEPEGLKSVYHLYVIRHKMRDELQSYLAENDISTGLHYPVPLHLQNAYSQLGYKDGDFPVSEKVSREILSLPMFPGLTEEQQKRVAASVKEFDSMQNSKVSKAG